MNVHTKTRGVNCILRMNRRAPGLAMVFALAAIASGCSRANPQAAGPQTPPPPLVSVAKAQAQDVPVYLDEIGKSYAFESVTVTPQVGGRITQRQFQDGADLAKGQLLFVIDPRPYQAQLDSAKGALAQAKAALELAKVEFARSSELFNSKVIAKQDYDAKKSTVEVDQAQVESAEAALETAQLNLEYCYIHSPIQGRAGAPLDGRVNITILQVELGGFERRLCRFHLCLIDLDGALLGVIILLCDDLRVE